MGKPTMKVTKLDAVKLDAVNSLPLEARAIQCITNFKAPQTSQDAVDQLAAEFATAAVLRTHAEKRYEGVKQQVTNNFYKHIAEVREAATNTMSKVVDGVVGNDWQLCFAANRPAIRCDLDELRTELIKCGVSVDLIDVAINKVSKKSQPATTITAKPVV
jgi:hypothetical protein